MYAYIDRYMYTGLVSKAHWNERGQIDTIFFHKDRMCSDNVAIETPTLLHHHRLLQPDTQQHEDLEEF